MAKKNTFIQRAAGKIVDALGFYPITKAEAEGAGFKSISLSLQNRGI